MNPKEAQELARVLEKMAGIRSIEFKDVRRLAELLREFPEIGSIEVKGLFDVGIVISRTGHPAISTAMPIPVGPHGPVAPAAPGTAPTGPVSPAVASLKDIKSPMVGTFYRAPEPGAEPYVKVGTRVTAGQTVCIIEAMKIMNEIESEVSGVVREVIAQNSQPVEFGQVLFRVDPHG
jgi:acetyl-CoA carboxylase biotin carboxyl carrier protein